MRTSATALVGFSEKRFRDEKSIPITIGKSLHPHEVRMRTSATALVGFSEKRFRDEKSIPITIGKSLHPH